MQRTYNLISDAAKAAINTREVGYFGSISVAGETILRHRIDLESAQECGPATPLHLAAIPSLESLLPAHAVRKLPLANWWT